MIRWPIKSAKAISRLFRSVQNIDIFVEDQGDEAFYTMLFKKFSSDKLIINRVVALGGCEEVKSAAEAYRDERAAVFIIDGDLQWLRGDPAPVISRLYRLNCYCIENILIVRRAVIELCAEELRCSPEEAEGIINLERWESSMESLVPLFARFAVINNVEPEIPTVGEGLSKIIVADESCGIPTLCSKKIEIKINFFQEKIEQFIGREDGVSRVFGMEKRITELDNALHAISGKDYLLPMLLFHVKLMTKTRAPLETFRYRLASKCSAAELVELRRALDQAA